MSEHICRIVWERGENGFGYTEYSRNHEWVFDSGESLTASSSPAYRGDSSRIDPEEALVAAISSCHMLSFLAIASRAGYVLDSYVDRAVGHMEQNAEGKTAVTRVELNPGTEFSKGPDREALESMHHQAHEECFIANSVRTAITVNLKSE